MKNGAKERVIIESAELQDKINKLENFIAEPPVQLNALSMALLSLQLDTMQHYHDILLIRLKFWEDKQ